MKKKSLKQEEEQLEEKAKPFFSALLSLFLLLISFTGWSKSFDFNARVLQAQSATYSLKMDEARALLREELRANSNNGAAQYLLGMGYVMQAFITEDQAFFDAHSSEIEQIISALEKHSSDEAYRDYSIAEIKFYRACLKGKSEQFYSAALDLNSAYHLLKNNTEQFPNFIPNNKTLGLIEAFLSTVPEQYAWAVNLLGLKSNLNSGLSKLRQVAYMDVKSEEEKYIRKEAGYLYAFTLYQIVKKPVKAWSVMLDFTQDWEENLLSTFFRSSMADKLNKNEEVIRVLKNRPSGAAYVPFYYLDFIHGEALLNKLEPESIQLLLSFHENFKGRNYQKSALQKMSWYYFLEGEMALYRKYKSAIKTEGAAVNEEDQLALLFADKPDPHPVLLKTRLLFDGGYLHEAFELINGVKSEDFKSKSQKAEYAYRKGRIYESKGDMDIASKFYIACSKMGVESEEYYAPYACIYLADQYRQSDDRMNALIWYRKALTYKENKEYVNTIEQRAKQGIKWCTE